MGIKKLFALILSMALAFSLCSCRNIEKTEEPLADVPDNIETAFDPAEVSFPASPNKGSENITADCTVVLSDTTASATGVGATVSGNTVTISKAGKYRISGVLKDGRLVVDTKDERKVEIYLDGVSVTNSAGAAVTVLNATKKVVFYATLGSVNIFSDASSRTTDEEEYDGAVFSKEDLEFDGQGYIYVTGNYADGIVSKDSIEINNSNIYVSCVDDGIRGKDEVIVAGGSINITSGGDGIKSTNEEDEGEGIVNISAGNITIDSALDGIQAVSLLSVSGGEIHINSGEGSANSSAQQGNDNNSWGNWGGFGGRGGRHGGFDDRIFQQNETESTDSASAKGLKSAKDIKISAGNIVVDSSDDAVHSNVNVSISGGTLGISSGDDGIHADDTLSISGGVIKIDKSYEGLEALTLKLSGGTCELTASDDGFNAAGGNDSSSMMGRPGQNSFAAGDGSIIISGGHFTLNASGDGIDANGYAEMTGGTVLVYGPTDGGNGSLDYDSYFTVSGGTLLAVGSRGMAQGVTAKSQGAIVTSINNIGEGTSVEFRDQSGNAVFSFTAVKQFSHIVFSSVEIKKSVSYSVYADNAKLGSVKAQ